MRIRLLPLMLVLCSSVFAERYEDTVNGFSLEVPAGWQRMSSSELAYFQSLLDQNQMGPKSTYVVGFKSEGGEGEVLPPFLLVQVSPSIVRGVVGQYTAQDIRDMAEMITNGEMMKSIQPVLDRTGIDASQTGHELKPGLDESRKRIFHAMEILGPDGTIYGGAILQFGRRAGYQCLYYAKTMDEFASGALGMTTISSFELNANERWDPSLDSVGTSDRTVPSERMAYNIGRFIGALFMLGVIATGVVWLFRLLG